MSSPRCAQCGRLLRPPPGGGRLRCPHCAAQGQGEEDAATRTSAGSAAASAPQDYRGRSFGNYTIVEEISRGAMGVVYKARQHLLDRTVALKVLIAGDMATEAQVARFRREAQAAARLRHRSIVPIHEVGFHDGKHFYTMDYVEGENLSALIRAGRITTRRALEIAAQIAEALDYAHSRGVVHRDIKPSNVMLDAQGVVHILDFGLAKQLDADTKFTRTGTTIGTPAYMPPEQASGESRRVDHRADIYSLGAVLYEMLTGRAPFAGDTMMNTLMKVLNDEPVPPKRLNPKLHRDIQTIVLRCMEKPPERRYSSARALADDLRRFIAGESISARPPGLLYRGWRGVKKHRSAVWAVAAVAVVGLAAYLAIHQQRLRYEQQRQAASRQREQAFRTGRREGAEEVKKEHQRQERPKVQTVFDDSFAEGHLAERWVDENPANAWRRTAERHLEVEARRLAAIRTRERFGGNVAVRVEFAFPPPGVGPSQAGPAVGCFLGSDWSHSYRASFRGGPRPRLVLNDQRREVAEVACGPPLAGIPYRLTLRRELLGFRVVLESEQADQRAELTYAHIDVPRQLGSDFAAGLFAERARVQVRRVTVAQEYPPPRLSVLKAAEGPLRDGNIEEALNQYQKIAQGYQGRHEGLAALFGAALCHEAERRYERAFALLAEVEQEAKHVEHERLPALLVRVRLHRFFCSANRKEFDFPDAVGALRRIAQAGQTVEPAWSWHLPRCLASMVNSRAYGEALALLELPLFGPDGRTAWELAVRQQASVLEQELVRSARRLADEFAESGQSESLQALYAACSSPQLAPSLARAVQVALEAGRGDEALALLAFCSAQGLSAAPLADAARDVARHFCTQGRPERVPEVHDAFPQAPLGEVFVQAIRQATSAGRLDTARALLDAGLARLPEQGAELLMPAVELGRAFVARGEVLRPIELHQAFAQVPQEPAVVALFVEATEKAIEADQPEQARRLLDYARVNLGLLHKGLADRAARLVALHTEQGAYDQVLAAYTAYPNETLAPGVAQAIAAAAEAGRLAQALDLFRPYAANHHAIPEEAVDVLARELAGLPTDDEATETLLEQYHDIHEIYDSPVARATLTLALGDAYLRAGRLAEAAAQYDATGEMEGRLRATCVALELGHGEEAAERWQELSRLALEGDPRGAIAAFMSGELPLPTFRAAVASKVPQGLVHYLAGLRLWTEGDPEAGAELAKAAAASAGWFLPLAKRPRVPLSPPDEPAP
ncbi:MAG: protein kinase domain-containing protein [Candidatus Brocadiia bacterium]